MRIKKLCKKVLEILATMLVVMVCLMVDIRVYLYAADPEDQFQQSRHGIVHVGVKQKDDQKSSGDKEKWLGTGFLVRPDCTFATAKHVIRNVDNNAIVVRFQLPSDLTKVRTFPVRLLYSDTARDITFLKIDKIGGKPCNSGTLHVFSVYPSDSRALTGEEIVIIGYPVIADKDIDTPIIRTGIISSVEIKWESGQMYLLDLVGVPGFSGSPVIRKKTGEVVGLVYGPGPTKRAFGFEWATPLTTKDLSNATSEDIKERQN